MVVVRQLEFVAARRKLGCKLAEGSRKQVATAAAAFVAIRQPILAASNREQ